MTARATLGMLAWCFSIVVACDEAESPSPSECTSGCGDGQFCCLGACQDIGSVCGDAEGGSQNQAGGGAGVGGRGGGAAEGGGGANVDPCTPHDGATAVSTACQPDGTIIYCQLGETESCNPGYVCVDWVDPGTSVLDAYCPMQGETEICDPDYDFGTCQNDVAHQCLGSPGRNDPPTAPGHYQDFDCVALYGAQSMCIIDADTSRPICTMP